MGGSLHPNPYPLTSYVLDKVVWEVSGVVSEVPGEGDERAVEVEPELLLQKCRLVY